MNVLSVTRKLTRIAAAILTLTSRIEAKVVGLHIRKLRDARTDSVAGVVEATRQHTKFVDDQHRRIMVIEDQTTRSIAELERKKREAAALSVAAALEITKLGGTI